MLEFFRRYAVTIAVSVVLFFVATMFTGMFFPGCSDAEVQRELRDPKMQLPGTVMAL